MMVRGRSHCDHSEIWELGDSTRAKGDLGHESIVYLVHRQRSSVLETSIYVSYIAIKLQK